MPEDVDDCLRAVCHALLVLFHCVDDRLPISQVVEELVAPGFDERLIATRQCLDKALLALLHHLAPGIATMLVAEMLLLHTCSLNGGQLCAVTLSECGAFGIRRCTRVGGLWHLGYVCASAAAALRRFLDRGGPHAGGFPHTA